MPMKIKCIPLQFLSAESIAVAIEGELTDITKPTHIVIGFHGTNGPVDTAITRDDAKDMIVELLKCLAEHGDARAIKILDENFLPDSD